MFLKQNKTKDHWRKAEEGSVSETVQELSIAIDADVHLPAVDLGSIHNPARIVRALRTVEPDCPTALRPSVLHLDLCKLYLACRK